VARCLRRGTRAHSDARENNRDRDERNPDEHFGP
jgi:hypothetical protein